MIDTLDDNKRKIISKIGSPRVPKRLTDSQGS